MITENFIFLFLIFYCFTLSLVLSDLIFKLHNFIYSDLARLKDH